MPRRDVLVGAEAASARLQAEQADEPRIPRDDSEAPPVHRRHPLESVGEVELRLDGPAVEHRDLARGSSVAEVGDEIRGLDSPDELLAVHEQRHVDVLVGEEGAELPDRRPRRVRDRPRHHCLGDGQVPEPTTRAWGEACLTWVFSHLIWVRVSRWSSSTSASNSGSRVAWASWPATIQWKATSCAWR